MRNENLIKSLKLNKFNDDNIKLILQLKEVAEGLGFEYNEYDAMDGSIFVTFSIKEEQ
jgi:hypothetical protein